MIKLNGKYLTITDYPYGDYDIQVHELSTVKGLEGWLCHMNEKVWFTKEMANELIKKCQEKFGYVFDGKHKY